MFTLWVTEPVLTMVTRLIIFVLENPSEKFSPIFSAVPTCSPEVHRMEKCRRRYLEGLSAAFLLATTWLASAGESGARAGEPLAYAGNYRVSGNRLMGVDPFIMDDGTSALLISDYSSGVVRRLFPVSKTEFAMGAGFNAATPVELTVRFTLDAQGDATGIALRHADGKQSTGERIRLKREELIFQGAEFSVGSTKGELNSLRAGRTEALTTVAVALK